jgi:hypothetical protein
MYESGTTVDYWLTSSWFVTTTTNKIEFVTYGTMSFFSLSPSPDINNLSSSFFNQSNKIRLSIDVVCLVVTSFFSLSPSVLFFFSLKAKMSSTHFIYFTYTTNSPSSPYIYILPSIQSIFIHVRIFQEKKKRETLT